MPEFLTTLVDKFTFKVATDRYYNPKGCGLEEGNRVRIGLSDFVQQRSGDVAFAEVKPAGTACRGGSGGHRDDQGEYQPDCPCERQNRGSQPGMSDAPEAINQDPYGAGWLAVLEAPIGRRSVPTA